MPPLPLSYRLGFSGAESAMFSGVPSTLCGGRGLASRPEAQPPPAGISPHAVGVANPQRYTAGRIFVRPPD
jgi:hypothetical protein